MAMGILCPELVAATTAGVVFKGPLGIVLAKGRLKCSSTIETDGLAFVPETRTGGMYV